MKLPVKIFIISAEILSAIALLTFNVNLKSKPVILQAFATTPTATAQSATMPQIVEEKVEEVETAAESAKPSKDNYIIAFMGDSMIDTMGGGLPYVYNELKAKYPGTDFVLYNYGIGAENVIEGLSRFNLPYSYKDRQSPPVPELGADIVILGSYSYNPITPFDKNQQWLLLSELIAKAKAINTDVYILAEQAPIKEGFGQGIGGVNWPSEIAYPHVEKILDGLKNAVGLASATNIGLINVYENSKADNSDYGNPEYVATHDGIHYSEEGQHFSARIIADSISLK